VGETLFDEEGDGGVGALQGCHDSGGRGKWPRGKWLSS
jgi:hypothetical protein